MNKNNITITLSSFLLLLSSNTLANENKIKKLDTVTIKAKSDYTKLNRNNLNISDTPKSIQVFNETLIRDLQPQSIEELVTMSSNVISFGDNNGRENVFAIRGFMELPILRDGVSVDNAIANPELYNLESVEILKGPDSLQFGEGGAGGLINLVTKKPDKKDFFGEIILEGDSESKKGIKFDVANSLNEDGSTRFRFVSTYSKQNNYKNYKQDVRNIFLAPSLAFDINDFHTITFVGEYLRRDEPVDYGYPIKSNGKIIGDYDSILNHPDDRMTSSQKTLGLDINSDFSSWDSLFKYRYVNYEMDIGDTYVPASYSETKNLVNRMYSYMEHENKEHIFQYTLNKDFDIANTLHKVTLGVDYRKLKQKTDNRYYSNRTAPNFSFLTINYLDQVFEPSMNTDSDYPFTIAFGGKGTDIERYGTFIQDSIDVTDNFIINLGLRHDKNDFKQHVDNNSYSKKATTPSLGTVYKLTKNTSFFANYSKSFNMQDVRYSDEKGRLLEPAQGIGYEAGMKNSLFDGKLNISTSMFKIKKDNMPVYQAIGRGYYTSDSTQKSKGFEFDINGQITPDWSILASYGYVSTKANYDIRGRKSKKTYFNQSIVGIPKHSANIFSTYYLNQNIYLTGNMRFIGKRYADYKNSVKVDSSTIFNTSANYRVKNWGFTLGIKNITNKKYFEAVGGNGLGVTFRNNFIGTPRTVYANLSYLF